MGFGKKHHKNPFGKKAGRDLTNFGKKALHQADIIERKVVNSIDKVAPVVAMAADAYMPGSGQAVMTLNDGIQGAHTSLRQGVKMADQYGKAKSSEERAGIITNFEAKKNEAVANAKASVNQSDQILRDAKNAQYAQQQMKRGSPERKAWLAQQKQERLNQGRQGQIAIVA